MFNPELCRSQLLLSPTHDENSVRRSESSTRAISFAISCFWAFANIALRYVAVMHYVACTACSVEGIAYSRCS